ncbi:MAG: T9SS type A sorting domain-containing protein [Bacteroidota bacterium]
MLKYYLFYVWMLFAFCAFSVTPELSLNNFRIPVSFTKNHGQVLDEHNRPRPEILYSTQIGSTGVFFSNNAITYVFNDFGTKAPGQVSASSIRIRFANANAGSTIIPGKKNKAAYHYYTGKLQGQAARDVESFEKLTYKELYRGIDLVFKFDKEGLKYDFIVHPGADLSDIRMDYEHADGISADEEEKLTVRSLLGKLTDHIPYSYYLSDKGSEKEVKVKHHRHGNSIGFCVGSYDRSRTLVIDPVQDFFNAFGNTSGWYTHTGNGITTNLDGTVNIVGYTDASPFIAGATAYGTGGSSRGFIASFDASGTLLWVTTIEGTGATEINDVAKTAYTITVCGSSDDDLAGTSGGYKGNRDGFIASFSTGGALIMSRYIGSPQVDVAKTIAMSTADYTKLIIGGYSEGQIVFAGSNLPVNPIPYMGARDGFIATVVSFSSGLLGYTEYSYMGSPYSDDEVTDVLMDDGYDAIITGHTASDAFNFVPAISSSLHPNWSGGDDDVFVVRMDYYGGLTSIINGTFIGDDGGNEKWPRVDIDNDMNSGVQTHPVFNDKIYLSMITTSSGMNAFTSVASFQQNIASSSDNFFMMLSNNFSSCLYGSFLFEAVPDPTLSFWGVYAPCVIKTDIYGNTYVMGTTNGSNFSYTDNQTGASPANGSSPNYLDIFLARFNPDNTHAYTTLLGGTYADIAQEMCLDKCNRYLFITGKTYDIGVTPPSAVNCRVDLESGSPVFTISSSNGSNLPSTLSVINNMSTLPAHSVQWYLDGMPVQTNTGSPLTFFANIPGTYHAVLKATSQDGFACGELHTQNITFEISCEPQEVNMIEQFSEGNGTTTFDGQNLYLDGDLVVPSGISLIIKNCLMVGTPCSRIVVQDGGELYVDGSALTGCPNWHGIVQEEQQPGFNMAVLIQNSGISRADVGVLSVANNFSYDILRSEVTTSNFAYNLNHLGYTQAAAFNFVMGGVNNLGLIAHNNFLALDERDYCSYGNGLIAAGELYPNAQLSMHNMLSHEFSDNFFFGTTTPSSGSYIKTLEGDHAVVRFSDNRVNGTYRSCIDIYNAPSHEIIQDNQFVADIQDYGIRFNGDNNNLAHARYIDNNIITNTQNGNSSIAGISERGAELGDYISSNTIRNFTNGIEYFQDRVWTDPADLSHIRENTVYALRSGVVVSYAEDPYNNYSGNNALVSASYSYPLFTWIYCNRIAADYGILGTGVMLNQVHTSSSLTTEADAGNTFSCNYWDIIWGNNTGSGFTYHTTPAFIPNTSPVVGANNVVLDGTSYGISSTNDFIVNITYSSSGLPISQSGCRRSFDDKSIMASVMKEQMIQDQVTLYPNPAVTKFTVETSANAAWVEIYDMTGRLILKPAFETGRKHLTVDASAWKEGVYIIRLYDNSGKLIKAEKVMKIK